MSDLYTMQFWFTIFVFENEKNFHENEKNFVKSILKILKIQLV